MDKTPKSPFFAFYLVIETKYLSKARENIPNYLLLKK